MWSDDYNISLRADEVEEEEAEGEKGVAGDEEADVDADTYGGDEDGYGDDDESDELDEMGMHEVDTEESGY